MTNIYLISSRAWTGNPYANVIVDFSQPYNPNAGKSYSRNLY